MTLTQDVERTSTPEEQPAVVSVSKLTKRYGSRVVAHDVSFALRQGEFLSLLGPSGSGKTTVLRMIAGLTRPDGGSIHIADREVFGPDVSVAAEDRRIGMVFQDYALWPHMTVADNVAFPLRLRRTPRSLIQAEVARLLALVELTGFERRFPNQLSGGQQQRVALARALAAQPAVLLLDEPLASLDTGLREAMREEIASIVRRTGMTVINVTHDQDEAMVMSDRVVLLRDGRVEQMGSPATLYWQPRSSFVAQFMGAANLLSGAVAEATADSCAISIADGVLHGVNTEALANEPGVPATLFCRPEDIAIQTQEPATNENRLEARIVRATFSSGRWRATALTTAGVELTISAMAESLPEGTIWLTIPRAKLRRVALD